MRGYLAAGRNVSVEADVYSGDPREALGLRFATVQVPDELGPMPDWLIPGRGHTWAIVAHGINGTPQEGLHLAPALRHAGLPAMLITYRGDLGAPASPDGFHHMGLTEWRDLQAAARHALAHGARRLILIGFSMGGAIVAQFMEALAVGLTRQRPRTRRAGARLAAGARIQRDAEGLPGLRRAAAGVSDRGPYRRRLGQPRCAQPTRGLPPPDPALPRHGRQGRADFAQRRLRRGAAALGHLLPRAARRPRRVLERRSAAVRKAPDRIPIALAGLSR